MLWGRGLIVAGAMGAGGYIRQSYSLTQRGRGQMGALTQLRYGINGLSIQPGTVRGDNCCYLEPIDDKVIGNNLRLRNLLFPRTEQRKSESARKSFFLFWWGHLGLRGCSPPLNLPINMGPLFPDNPIPPYFEMHIRITA
jgi:hypothetical protein